MISFFFYLFTFFGELDCAFCYWAEVEVGKRGKGKARTWKRAIYKECHPRARISECRWAGSSMVFPRAFGTPVSRGIGSRLVLWKMLYGMCLRLW
jgi:hypothetical protein